MSATDHPYVFLSSNRWSEFYYRRNNIPPPQQPTQASVQRWQENIHRSRSPSPASSAGSHPRRASGTSPAPFVPAARRSSVGRGPRPPLLSEARPRPASASGRAHTARTSQPGPQFRPATISHTARQEPGSRSSRSNIPSSRPPFTSPGSVASSTLNKELNFESPDVRQEPDDAPALAFQLQQPPPVPARDYPGSLFPGPMTAFQEVAREEEPRPHPHPFEDLPAFTGAAAPHRGQRQPSPKPRPKWATPRSHPPQSHAAARGPAPPRSPPRPEGRQRVPVTQVTAAPQEVSPERWRGLVPVQAEPNAWRVSSHSENIPDEPQPRPPTAATPTAPRPPAGDAGDPPGPRRSPSPAAEPFTLQPPTLQSHSPQRPPNPSLQNSTLAGSFWLSSTFSPMPDLDKAPPPQQTSPAPDPNAHPPWPATQTTMLFEGSGASRPPALLAFAAAPAAAPIPSGPTDLPSGGGFASLAALVAQQLAPLDSFLNQGYLPAAPDDPADLPPQPSPRIPTPIPRLIDLPPTPPRRPPTPEGQQASATEAYHSASSTPMIPRTQPLRIPPRPAVPGWSGPDLLSQGAGTTTLQPGDSAPRDPRSRRHSSHHHPHHPRRTGHSRRDSSQGRSTRPRAYRRRSSSSDSDQRRPSQEGAAHREAVRGLDRLPLSPTPGAYCGAPGSPHPAPTRPAASTAPGPPSPSSSPPTISTLSPSQSRSGTATGSSAATPIQPPGWPAPTPSRTPVDAPPPPSLPLALPMDSAAEDSPVPGDATAVQRALAVLRVHAPAFFQQLAHLPVAGEGPSDPSLDAAAQAPDRSCLRTPDEAKPRLLSHVSTDEVEASPIGDNEQQQQHHHHSAEGQPRRTHRHRSRGTDGAEVGQRQRSGRRRKSVGSAVSDVPSGVAECPEPLDAKLLHDSTGELPQEDDHVIKTPASDDHGPRSGRPKRALFTIHCATLNLHTTFQTAAGPIAPSSNPGTLSGTAGLPVSLAEALATFHTVAGLAGASGVAHHPSPGAIDVAAAVDSITENPEGAAPKPVKVPITSICQPPLPPVPAAPQPAYVPAALPAATYDASRGMAAPMAAERDAGTPHPATHTPGIHSRRSSASDLFLAPGLSAPRQPPLGAVPRQDSPALSPGPSVQSTPSRATREPPRCRIPLPSSQGTEAGPTSDHTRAVGRTFLLDSLPAVKDSPRGRGMEDHAPHEALLLPWQATPPPWSAVDATVTALCPSYRALWEAAHQPSVCRTKRRPPPRSPSNSSMSTFSRSHPADSDSEEIDRLLQLQATEGPSATSAWLRSGAAAGRKRGGGSTAASTDRPEWPLGVWSLGQRATVGAGGLTI